MDKLKETVTRVVSEYASPHSNARLFFTTTPDGNLLTVLGIGAIQGKRFVTTYQVVEITGNHVVIHQDLSDKIVVDALVQAGIPRQQIILAYAGESIPEAA